jgi:hypothetical protein
MDISTFRWILIIAGLVIVAGIFLFGSPDKKRKPKASRKRVHAQRVRREPALDSAGGDGQDDVSCLPLKPALNPVSMPSLRQPQDHFRTK